MSESRDLIIQSILGATQHEDCLEFEITLKDGDGNAYLSRFTVRNHNVGLLNRALRKLRPLGISVHTLHVAHATPEKPGSVAGSG